MPLIPMVTEKRLLSGLCARGLLLVSGLGMLWRTDIVFWEAKFAKRG